MAPEQGPDSKNVSSGKKMYTTTNELESGREHRNGNLSQSTLQTDSLAWIYLLRKNRLIEVCREQGIPISEGVTVDHLRRQLSDLIKTKRQKASSENLLQSLEEEIIHEEQSPALADHTPHISSRENKPTDSPTDAEVMNIIRRWDLAYEGGDNLIEFMERLEELADCYKINHDRMLFSLLEILKGKALQWYRIKREHIRSWNEFKHEASRFFLPKRYFAHLEESVYHRKQGPREKAKDFILALQTLIRQHPELRKLDHTDRIYDGLRYEYKLYVRRSDFRTVDELMELTDEFEHLKREEAKQHRPQPSHYISLQWIRCWQCKQMGHIKKECPNPRRLSEGNSGMLSHSKAVNYPEFPNKLADGRYYISIYIFGQPIRALVDTGSTLSYIGEPIRKILKEHKIRPRALQRKIQLADRSCVKVVEIYPLSILFNGKRTNLLASALGSLAEPVILGMDFLHRRQAKLFMDGVEIQTIPAQHNMTSNTLHTIKSRDFLTPADENRLQTILSKAKGSFENIKGPCNVGEHRIYMKHDQPIKQRYYPRNPAMQAIIDQEVDELLNMDRIEPSRSPYSSPIVLVRKKQGTWRMCIDYRQINAAAKPDAYPLPQINAILDQLRPEEDRAITKANRISIQMERKPTRPLAPGKIGKYLRQTQMPRHVPAYMPPFEARPKILSVESTPVADSGNDSVDELARKVWEKRTTPHSLCTITTEPPPLAPLSAAGTNTPVVSTSTPVPPLAPLSEDIVREAESEKERTEEVDILDDILTLDAPHISEDEEDEAKDPFRGIVIKDVGPRKNRSWTIYPKGRPKVQVKIREGEVQMRCQGAVKTFRLD